MADFAAQINHFGFYHSSQSVYCTIEILEVNIFDKNNKFINHYNTIEKGQKVNLKYTEDNYKELLEILQDRILRIRSQVVEISKDRTGCQSTKFIIESAKKCEILLGN